jgi:hypothetical protein
MPYQDRKDNNQHRITVQSGPSQSAGALYDTLRVQTWTSNLPADRTISILSPAVGYLYQLSFLYLSSYPPGVVTARILKNNVEAFPFYGPGIYHYERGSSFPPSFVTGDSCKINLVVPISNDWTYNSYVGFFKIPI